MARHSPLPWSQVGLMVTDEFGKSIASCGGLGVCTAVAESNARLIASLGALLAASQAVIDADDADDHTRLSDTVNRLGAVIAAAVYHVPSLRPCPFCGATPQQEPWHGGAPTKVRISCSDDHCDIQPAVTGETPAAAAERWNRRAV